MCSTPKSSGITCKVGRFVDQGADYASYSKMLRRASNRFDQRDREAQRKRQTDAQDSLAKTPVAEEPQPSPVDVRAVRPQPHHKSVFLRLLSFWIRWRHQVRLITG